MHWRICNVKDVSQQMRQQAYEQMSPSRKKHVDRLRRQPDKDRTLAAEVLVQQLLQENGICGAVLHRSANGCPFLTGCTQYVSISHCEDMVACAISEERVGIDIERIRPVDLRLCHRVCTEEELAYVLSETDDQNTVRQDELVLQRFFEVWTGKEAYFKKCGTGITSLKSVNILSLPRRVYTVGEYVVQII